MMAATTQLAAEGGGFHVPSLDELFQYAPYPFAEDWSFFGLFGIGVNRVVVLTFLSVLVIAVIFHLAFNDAKVVPGKFQAAMEGYIAFIRDYIVLEVIGKDGLRYVPFLSTLFIFIFVNNFFKVTPFIIFPTTGRMGLPMFLALVVWAMFIIIGVRQNGLGTYLKSVAIPPGVPMFILPLVVPIEVVSTFIVRPFTLAIRLFANMMAGHILIALTLIAVNAFLFDVHELSFNLRGLPLGLVMLGASPLVFGFEMLVVTLQAYIFTTLAAVYIGSSLHPEH